MSDVNIIDTGAGAKDGQTKCPKCGATDISLNTATGELRCNFCRHTFTAEVLEEMKPGATELKGEQIGSGAADIDESADTSVTLKCTSCGAEVVVDLNETSQARCHWCRIMLSINSKVPNGMVPDAVLPFKMKKDEAQRRIEEYVGSRKFFANKKFQAEFTTENIMGVYFPYMLVDMKGHAEYEGEGEIEKGSYTRSRGKDETETVYKVERYKVGRSADVEIDGLAVESSARRAGRSEENETNNIINAILPFDTENCVKYDSNYLKGFTSEKRDVNKGDLQVIVDSQEKEAIKFSLNDTAKQYDRGIRWDRMDVKKEGEKWMAAYLPVWLYSYVENPGKKNQLIHYVAVNARTTETVGSVPINKSRVSLASVGLGVLVWLLTFLTIFNGGEASDILLSVGAGVIVGLLFFSSVYGKYRNTGARHHFETETNIKLSNVGKRDESVKRFETTDSSMHGANNHNVVVEKLKK